MDPLLIFSDVCYKALAWQLLMQWHGGSEWTPSVIFTPQQVGVIDCFESLPCRFQECSCFYFSEGFFQFHFHA